MNPQAIDATLPSVVLAQTLPEQASGATYLVVISLKAADSPTGFAWALGGRPDVPIKDGSLTYIDIVLGLRSSITYLTPGR